MDSLNPLDNIASFSITPTPVPVPVIEPAPAPVAEPAPVAIPTPVLSSPSPVPTDLETRVLKLEQTLGVIVPAFSKLLTDVKTFNVFGVMLDLPQVIADFRAVEAAVKGI